MAKPHGSLRQRLPFLSWRDLPRGDSVNALEMSLCSRRPLYTLSLLCVSVLISGLGQSGGVVSWKEPWRPLWAWPRAFLETREDPIHLAPFVRAQAPSLNCSYSFTWLPVAASHWGFFGHVGLVGS